MPVLSLEDKFLGKYKILLWYFISLPSEVHLKKALLISSRREVACIDKPRLIMQLCPHLILCLEEYTCCLQAIDLFSSVVCYKLHTQDMTMTITDRAGNSVTFDANRFAAALVVAQVVGGVPLYPFQVNPGMSPFCQVNVKFTVA